jgi:ketosteroid isomerase-like protein
MRRTIHGVFVVVALSLSGACTPSVPIPPPGPTEAEMISAADALDERFLDAFNKGDLDALTATYWNNPKLVSFAPDGMGTTGWDAARAGITEMFTAMPGAKLEFLTRHNDVHGNLVLGWGTFRMTIPTPGGPQVMEGRYTDAKMMHDGKWVYVMDHASVPLPPPPPEPVKK